MGAASRFAQGLEWPIVAYFIVMHAGVLLCFVFPSLLAAETGVVLYLVTGLGITIGYHRLLAHNAFGCARWLERLWALCGLLAGEGPPLFWVMNHRKHHTYSDLPGDPHSPTESFAWAHWLWLFPKYKHHELGSDYARWVPKLTVQPFYRRLESTYLWIQAGFGGVIVLAGYLAGSWYMAFSFLAYAYFLRMVLVLHATWLVNSLSHTAGYRNYETEDRSRNNPFVAVVALGEGWHNNHHQVQASVNHGHRWWELDLSLAVIVMLALLSAPLGWIGAKRLRPVYDLKFYEPKSNRLERWFP